MPLFKTPTAGELRHQVTIQQLGTQVPDGMGGYTTPWIDVVTVWAKFEAWKGKELLLSDQPASSMFWEVGMRYRPGITNAMRLYEKATGIWYNIRFADDPDKRKQWLRLSVEAVKQS